jgi:hypothetical protein
MNDKNARSIVTIYQANKNKKQIGGFKIAYKKLFGSMV